MSKPREPSAGFKNKNNHRGFRGTVPEIKLKRTDTTLDLSQKAKRAKEEKRRARGGRIIYLLSLARATLVWRACDQLPAVDCRRRAWKSGTCGEGTVV
jgi:hypothetical protein